MAIDRNSSSIVQQWLAVQIKSDYARSASRFMAQPFMEFELDRIRRSVRREKNRRLRAEDKLQATEEALHQAKADLAVEKEAREQLQATWRCRDCNADRWYSP